jgi:hypothetical protein
MGPALPALQNGWLADLTGITSPSAEKPATCDDCAMWHGSRAAETKVAFSRETKCCTYTPNLANFLVGGALLPGEREAGRSSVQARIAARVGVTPLGLDRPAPTALLSTHARHEFGRSVALRCPHYVAETGECGIWAHRNAVCATRSLRFWQAVRDLLTAVERQLSLWCLTRLGLPAEQVAYLMREAATWRDLSAGERRWIPPGELDATVPDDRYAGLWGNWAGREKEWYLACAEVVGEMTAAEIDRAVGAEVRALAVPAVAAADARRVHAPPQHVELGQVQVRRASEDDVLVTGYSEYDPLRMPAALLAALSMFDGQPTAEVVERMAGERGLRLAEDLVAKLRDFHILVDAAPPAETTHSRSR